MRRLPRRLRMWVTRYETPITYGLWVLVMLIFGGGMVYGAVLEQREMVRTMATEPPGERHFAVP